MSKVKSKSFDTDLSTLESAQKRGFIHEFKEFIARGNVIELAVGLTVGTAFTALVNSLVNNILMPIISIVLKGELFRDRYIALDGNEYKSLEIAQESGAPLLKYGQVISDMIDFVIIALAIFVVVKVVTKIRTGFEVNIVAFKQKK